MTLGSHKPIFHCVLNRWLFQEYHHPGSVKQPWPSQACCRLFVRRKEIKSCSRSPIFLFFFSWIIKHSGQCRHELKTWDSASEKQEWLLESLVTTPRSHQTPLLQQQKSEEIWWEPSHIIPTSSCPKELLWWAVQSPIKNHKISQFSRLYPARVQLQFPSYK